MRLFLLAALLFTGADGGRIWIIDSQVVAIFDGHRAGGAAQTAIATLQGTYFVRDPPETVAEQLGWKK
jgi:hypothetical protein